MGICSVVQHSDLRATAILKDICSWARSVIILKCVVSIDSNMAGVDSSPNPYDERKAPIDNSGADVVFKYGGRISSRK